MASLETGVVPRATTFDVDEEKYQQLISMLQKLPLNESNQKEIVKFVKEMETIISKDGLQKNIQEFTQIISKFHPSDVSGGFKLIQLAYKIFNMVKDSNQVASALYIVVIAGMSLYNQQTNEESIQTIIKRLLDDQSDMELLRECDGIKTELLLGAKFLCALTNENLSDHEISLTSSVIDIGRGIGTMGKLASRIIELREAQHNNYCKRSNTEVKKLMELIEVYCRLASMKYGIWLHYYSLLKLSENSQNIARATKTVIETQEANDRRLLEFLVYPSKRTAIIHYLGDFETQIAAKTLLEVRGMTDCDLSFLCEGEFRLSSVKYENSRLYMATLFKIVRWGDTQKTYKSRFSFKRVCDKGNFFHIYSKCFPGYHVRKYINGFWVDGGSGTPSNEQDSTWKIVPVNVDNTKPSAECMYAMLAPKQTKDIFLFAGFTGRVCVQKFTEEEFEQVLWKIAKV